MQKYLTNSSNLTYGFLDHKQVEFTPEIQVWFNI